MALARKGFCEIRKTELIFGISVKFYIRSDQIRGTILFEKMLIGGQPTMYSVLLILVCVHLLNLRPQIVPI